MRDFRLILDSVVRDFRRGWKQLVLADVIYKVLALVLLTPLVSVLFRVLLAAAGRSVLADQDILFFLLGPAGWLCFVAVGGLWLAIVALEHAALLAVIGAHQAGQRIPLIAALAFAKRNAWPVLRVTARIVGFTLLAAAPFLAVAGATYAMLLAEYDINYYLKERPPVFLVALGIGGVLAAAMIAVLLRLFAGWFFALPLVLFEQVRPADALRISGQRARGHRRRIVLWIVSWIAASTLLSAVLTSLVAGLGNLVVPRAAGSLYLLALAIGTTLMVWAVLNLAVNLLSTIAFASILFNLYHRFAGAGDVDVSRLTLRDASRAGVGVRLTRTRLIALGISSLFIAATVGGFLVRSAVLEDHVTIIAHRGASKVAPENTLAAVRQAIADNTDFVEIDVQETADGQVVVFHDSDFMKLAGVNRKIWEVTLAELQDIDVGSWFGPEFKNERVPTLAQVLDTCRGKARVNIELKYYGHDQQLEQRVVDIVEAHGMAQDVVIMSLKLDAVQKMKALRPDWTVGLLLSVSAGNLQRSGADFLAVNASFASRRFISGAHQRGQDVYVWTVNDAATMSTMISRGVDGLITDKPALARSVLAQRAQMSPPERLLLELARILGVTPEIGEI